MLDRIDIETGLDILFDIAPVEKIEGEIHTTPDGIFLVIEYPKGSGRHMSFQMDNFQ